jgi:hypothetical protein
MSLGKSLWSALCFAMAAVVLAAPSAHAYGLLLDTNATADRLPAIPANTDTQQCLAGGSSAVGPVSCSVVATFASSEATADGTLDYGSVGLTASASNDGLVTGTGMGTAAGQWFDNITMSGGGATGTSGSMTIALTLSGSLARSSPFFAGGAFASAILSAGNCGPACFHAYTYGIDSVSEGGTADGQVLSNVGGFFTVHLVDMPFEWDIAAQFDLSANASANAGTSQSSALADLGSTFEVEILEVFDGGGAPITTFTATADSGHSYVAVPEPTRSTLLLFSSVVIGLLRASKRRDNA